MGDFSGHGAATPPADEELSLEGRRIHAAISSHLFARGEEPVRIGRFMVVGRLGEGAMGVVYRAYDPELDRLVAVKVLRPHLLAGLRAKARLRREAKALAKLNHPNVLTLFEVGQSDDLLFLALEFVSGSTLSQWCIDRELDRPQRAHKLLQFALQSARGLAAAHAHGLIHRDFKPSNLLVGEDDRIRIADFGLVADESEPSEASAERHSTRSDDADPRSAELTGTGRTVGTPAYMAPEQIEGRADAQSDQFAWAVTFYQAFTSVRPFAGATLGKIVESVRAQRFESSRTHRLPPKLRPVFERALSFDPNDRYESMAAVVVALEAASRRRVSWLGVGGLGVVLAGVASFATVTQLEAHTETACEEQANEIEDHWNERRRGDVGERLRATGLPFATHTFARTAQTLDAYQQNWADARRAACVASPDAAPLHAESLSCLSQRRQAFLTTIDALLEVEAGTLARTVAAADQLPPIDSCDDDAWLAARVKPPDDPTIAGQVEAARRHIVAAETLRIAGRSDDAGVRIEEAEAAIQGLGYAPIIGELLTARGTLERERGRTDAAENDLREAFTVASRAGDDGTAGTAASSLVYLAGIERQRFDEAELWYELSETMLTRAKAGETLQHARLISHHASVLEQRGDYKSAIAEHTRAIEIARSRSPERSSVVAGYAVGLAQALVHAGELDEARSLVEQVRREHSAGLGSTHPVLAHCALIAAVSNRQQGKYREAALEAATAVELFEGAYGVEHRGTAAALSALAANHYHLENYRESQRFHERALEIQRALLGDDHPELAASMANLANVYSDLGETAKAIALFEEGRRIWENAKGPDHETLAVYESNLARVYLSLSDYDKALSHYEKALAIDTKARDPGDPRLAYSLTGLGRLWIRKNEPDKARAYLERALEIRESATVAANLLAETRYHLGIAMTRTGDSKTAVAHLRGARAGYAGLGDTERVREIDEFAALNRLELGPS